MGLRNLLVKTFGGERTKNVEINNTDSNLKLKQVIEENDNRALNPQIEYGELMDIYFLDNETLSSYIYTVAIEVDGVKGFIGDLDIHGTRNRRNGKAKEISSYVISPDVLVEWTKCLQTNGKPLGEMDPYFNALIFASSFYQRKSVYHWFGNKIDIDKLVEQMNNAGVSDIKFHSVNFAEEMIRGIKGDDYLNTLLEEENTAKVEAATESNNIVPMFKQKAG